MFGISRSTQVALLRGVVIPWAIIVWGIVFVNIAREVRDPSATPSGAICVHP